MTASGGRLAAAIATAVVMARSGMRSLSPSLQYRMVMPIKPIMRTTMATSPRTGDLVESTANTIKGSGEREVGDRDFSS